MEYSKQIFIKTPSPNKLAMELRKILPPSNVRAVRTGVTITLDSLDADEVLRVIRNFGHEFVTEIAAPECGGGMTKTGDAQIVCSPLGESLHPIWKTERGYSNGVHARFVGRELILITIRRYGDGDMHAEIHRVNSNTVELIWAGHPDDLPADLGHFTAALQAAVEKGKCYHCRESHYVNPR